MYEEKRTWLVIRTFWKREMEVSAFLQEKGLVCFIPMTYRERLVHGESKPRRVMVPVIHNYVFVELSMPVNEFRELLGECPVPLHLLRNKDTNAPYEISNREMFEFRMLCDPSYDQSVIVQEGQEDAEIGKEVIVMHGQFAGVRGRLCRKQHKYWFIKTVAGISIMLRITRWYCKPV